MITLVVARSKPVDWFRVFVDLERAGWSLRLVERETKIPYRTLHAIKSCENRPLYENGRAVEALWLRIVGQGGQDLPRL